VSEFSLGIDYCSELDALADLLAGISKGGDFAASGALTSILPGVIVDGVGRIAFPLLPEQAKKIASVADQAPYGRGEKTLIDRDIRDVLQIEPGRFQLLGETWNTTLRQIVGSVAQGLGCEDVEIKAELYKLLLYPAGGFFSRHRDTEKASGMFGTLVVCLPSEHDGGELIIRHNHEEVRIDLSTLQESEILFAAFYCDCEHEVLPLDSGYRLCLIYNLIQVASSPQAEPLPSVPDNSKAICEAARILSDWREFKGRTLKIAYLLEHQYTPAGLSFPGLKLQDSARVQVLTQAADQAGFEIRLALVHIVELGSAEVYGYGRRGRWEDDDSSDPEDYELIEVYDHEQTVDSWIDLNGEKSDFGAIPLEEGELLPNGALDGEAPDEVRVSEATGNEGGSYERAYHRAVAVVWVREETGDLLLQRGVEATVPFFAGQVARLSTKSGRVAIKRFARRILKEWSGLPDLDLRFVESPEGRKASSDMLAALNDFGDDSLVADFLSSVLVRSYSGVENKELVRACVQCSTATLLDPILRNLLEEKLVTHFPELAQWFHLACRSELPHRFLRSVAKVMADGLSRLPIIPSDEGANYRPGNLWSSDFGDIKTSKQGRALRAEALSVLLGAIASLHQSGKLFEHFVGTIQDLPEQIERDTLLFPVLKKLSKDTLVRKKMFSLWQITAEFHLKRSATPPAKPGDWILRDQALECLCQLCSQVMEFALNPEEKCLRLPINQQARQHVHNEVDRAGLEMTHQTERKGRPFTLILTKTHWRYEARNREYCADCKRMTELRQMADVYCDGKEGESLLTQLGVALASNTPA
jgi:hypothetical protein